MPVSIPRQVHRKADNVVGIRKSENINGRYRVRFEGETKDTWIRFQDLVETHTEVPVPTAKAPQYKLVQPKNSFIANLQKGLQDRQKHSVQPTPPSISLLQSETVDEPVIQETSIQEVSKKSVDVESEQYANVISNNGTSSSVSQQSLQLLTPPVSPPKDTSISKEEEEMYHRILDESIEAHIKRKMWQALSPVLYAFSGLMQAVLLLLTILNVFWYFVRMYIICVGVSAIMGGHSQNMTSFHQYCNQTLYYTINQTREFHKQLSVTENAPNFCMNNQTGVYCEDRELEILHQEEELYIDTHPMSFMHGSSYTFTGMYEGETKDRLFKYDVPFEYLNVRRFEQYWPYLISLYMNPFTNPVMLYIPLCGGRSALG
jgi:hypothetical protein